MKSYPKWVDIADTTHKEGFSMSTVPQVASAIQMVLTSEAKRLGEESGFIEREREFDGASFAQTLVYGWLGNGQATLDELSQVADGVGVKVSRQGLAQRFTPSAAVFLRELLSVATQQAVRAAAVPVEIVRRFNGVYLVDSSIVQLPDSLLGIWQGSGGGQAGQTNAGVKLSLRWDWQHGQLEGPYLDEARAHDQRSPLAAPDLPPGSLRIADLGYFNLATLEALARQGAYWLTRYKAGTQVYSRAGQPLELATFLHQQPGDHLDQRVLLGAARRLSCRLIAQRLPPDIAAERRALLQKEAEREGQTLSLNRWLLAGWVVLLTNAPPDRLSPDQAFELYRVRWQIELLFKLWKSEGQIDHWRSANPWRILCELYAKLIASLIQHWLLITGCWHRPDRSFFQACRVVQRLAWALAFTMPSPDLFVLFVARIVDCLGSGARISPCRSSPPTFQRLQACA